MEDGMADRTIDTVIFDVGNVLLRWDPDPLIVRLAGDPETAEFVRTHVINHDWNLQLDGGKSWAEGCAEQAAAFPEHAELIHAFNACWEETLFGAIEGTVDVLERLHAGNVPLYALTNFSSEKFRLTRPKHAFFDRFRDILVSGDENMVKPDPAIYRRLLDRNGLAAERCVFIDDSAANVVAAEGVGLATVHFTSPQALAADLAEMGLAAR
jgi:2-haloacid dehalogenase